MSQTSSATTFVQHFQSGLLLAALSQRNNFLRAAEKIAGLERRRPSNGDVENFREYEAQVSQMIFRAFDVGGNPDRKVE